MQTNTADLYIGIMSGTSLDGIDTALVAFSEGKPEVRATCYRPYDATLKETLLALHQPTHDELHQALLLGNTLAREYAAAVATLLETAGVAARNITAIGCHGQTLRHRPEHGYSLQIGNHALLAELCGIAVVGDFRSSDIAAGGHGAPLVPAFHDMILRDAKHHRVIVNIGGIANLTNLPPAGETSGFDCGPGNMLLDAWVAAHRSEPYDRDGEWAASGRVIPALLESMLKDPYFTAPPPKSCGRDLFNWDWLQRHLPGDETPVDVQATLLALTAEGIAGAIKRFSPGATEIYLCGGGAHNGALRRALADSLPGMGIELTDVLGVDADWMEAIAFAWLAQQAMHGKPANLPRVTGARHPCILGAIHPAPPAATP